jgi:translocation and assembly module TamB
MKGHFSLSPGKVGQFSFQSLQTSLGYQGNQLSLSGSLEQRAGGPRLTWDGRLPLRLTLIPFRASWGEEDVRLRLQGEKTDLSLLTALTPEVQAAEGSVDLSAEWQGPMPRPQVSGQVRWGAGSIKFRQTGALYRLLPGVMRLQGNTLKVPQLVFESGGTATLTGEIRLAGFFPQDLDLRAHLENFKAVARAGSEVYGTGTAYLKGPIGAPVLTGRLQVPQASFRPIFFQMGLHDDIVRVRQPAAPPADTPGASLAPGLVRNLSMNILLEASGGVWVRDPRFKAEVAGAIRATKQPGEPPAVGGELRSLQGTIDIQDRIFTLVEGALHLPGKPRVPITIEARAIHEMTDVTLVLNISGPVKKPEIKFSSIPALPPQDILAYLLFGRPVRTLSREEYQVVSPQAMGVLGGITAKKLQELLGKDFPLLGDVTLKGGETRMGVSKPLTKDISISFERKTNPLSRDDMNQIRLEYRINRYLGVESQMGRRNSGADVLFNFDF